MKKFQWKKKKQDAKGDKGINKQKNPHKCIKLWPKDFEGKHLGTICKIKSVICVILP